MTLPIGVALASVGMGALLALAGARRDALLSTVRTFALVASVVVVLAHLLPDALAELGMPALGVFALALLAPALFERLAHESNHDADPSWVAVELGYVGLLVHKLGDGVALGLYGGAADDAPGLDVLVAVGVHTVPVTAVMTLAFAERYGLRQAALRAVGLGAAAVAGIVLVGSLPTETFHTLEPWIMAAAGGLLLHVIGHDWHGEARPVGWRRWSDLAAIGAGVTVGFVGMNTPHSPGHGDAMDLRFEILDVLVELTVETAPLLLFGLAVGAVLQTFGSKLPMTWLRAGSPLKQAIRGAVVGAPLPICACGVLPLAQSLKTRGAGPALVVAFLLATPELGVESFFLSVRFLGWPFAVVRLVTAVGVAIAAAMLVSWALGRRGETEADVGTIEADSGEGSVIARTIRNFDELLYHVGPFTVVGLVVAAYVQATLPTGAASELARSGLDILVISAVAMPSYVCAASATPLAAVLLAKGFSSGAVLAGLLLGPATNVATIGFLRAAFGTRAAFVTLGGLILGVWVCALAVNAVGLPVTVPANLATESHAHSWFDIGSTVLLGLMVLRAVWRSGLRGWLASLGEALGSHDHDHAHAHVSGHAH